MRRFLGILIALILLAGTANAVMVGYARNFAVAPAAPSFTAWTNSPAQLTGTWGASAGATSYNLYVRAGSAPTTSTYDFKYSGVTSPHTINGPLTDGVTYHAGVTAVNASGESAMSSTLSAAAAALSALDFFDDFNRADGPLASPWAALSGYSVATITSGTAGIWGSGYVSGYADPTDVYVSAILTPAVNCQVQIGVRVDPTTNQGYWVRGWDDDSEGPEYWGLTVLGADGLALFDTFDLNPNYDFSYVKLSVTGTGGSTVLRLYTSSDGSTWSQIWSGTPSGAARKDTAGKSALILEGTGNLTIDDFRTAAP